MSRHRSLVLGGARSGKSTWAEARLGIAPARYLATGYPDGSDDAEWQVRLDRHRARRPESWQTIESLDVAGQLGLADPRPLLVDCLTLWLTRRCDDLDAWESPFDAAQRLVEPSIQALAGAVDATRCEVVLVSNEVGSGVMPPTPAGRVFADLLGATNAAVARVCDEVVLMVAGIAVPVKGGAPSWRQR